MAELLKLTPSRKNTCYICGQYPTTPFVYATSRDAERSGVAACSLCAKQIDLQPPPERPTADHRLAIKVTVKMCGGLGPMRLASLNKSGFITIGDFLEPIPYITRRTGFSTELIERYQDDLRRLLETMTLEELEQLASVK